MTIVVAVSVLGTFAMVQNISVFDFGAPSAKSGAFLTGHVEAVVKDDAGNVIAYRQADNAIVNHGMAIIAAQVFSNINGSFPGSGGTGIMEGRVGWMSIGNNSGAATPDSNSTALFCSLEDATTDPGCAGGGHVDRTSCIRLASTMSNVTAHDTVQTPSPGNGIARINVTAVATFDGADCESQDISEAGIFNDATKDSGQMFAHNTFGSVTLTNTDSLELTWRFTFTDN